MVFNFTEYRPFLRAYLKQLPKGGFGEASKIAAHLGVSSTYISQVFAGDKQFTAEQALALAKYLGLGELESEYLLNLVQIERAGTSELRKHFASKREELRKKSLKLVNRLEAKKTMTEEEKSIFYSTALYSSIHIFCSTFKKGCSLEDIANRFEITRSKAAEMMRFLVEAGMSYEEKGHFFTSTQGTHLEAGSPHLQKHHANWRLRAIQAAESLQEDELMYTLNIAISQKDFAILREEMVKFIKSFLEKAYPSPSEEIACLNLDWFRIRQ